MRSKKSANHQKDQGAKQYLPAVCDRAPNQSVVETIKAPLALLFNTESFLLRRSLDVVAQKWNERHRNNKRAQQRSGHHDRQAAEELAGIAVQHQKRKV